LSSGKVPQKEKAASTDFGAECVVRGGGILVVRGLRKRLPDEVYHKYPGAGHCEIRCAQSVKIFREGLGTVVSLTEGR
jgi:hypothetical protein